MENNIKLSVAMDLLNQEICKLNMYLAENQNDQISKDKLNHLLDLKNSIYAGNLDGIDEFLEKYKENNL